MELGLQYMAQVQKGESKRTAHLAMLDAYFFNRQYEFLPRAWDEDLDSAGKCVPFRQRRPSTKLPIARVIVNTFKRHLWGAGRRPKATIAGADDEANGYLDDIIAEAKLRAVMAETTGRALRIGTGLVVWKIQDGRLSASAWAAQYARPTFKPGKFPELEAVDYRFRFKREVEEDGRIKAVEFWHREVIDAKAWTVYQDVEVGPGVPTWAEDTKLSHEHGLGFCPATWFILGERGLHDMDGTGAYDEQICELIDELNYTASQEGRALYYNLDPQAVMSGVTKADIGPLKKGGSETWCLEPENAKAFLLESNGSYIEAAERRIDELKKEIYDAAGICLPDPERIKGAQSGTSLELLAQPQTARVDELREDVGDAYCRLLEQILGALASENLAPAKVRIDVRDGNVARKSSGGRVVLTWGQHFPRTPTDTAAASTAAKALVEAKVISRQAAARYLAPFVGLEDVEADQELIEADEKREDERMTAFEISQRRAMGLDIKGAK